MTADEPAHAVESPIHHEAMPMTQTFSLLGFVAHLKTIEHDCTSQLLRHSVNSEAAAECCVFFPKLPDLRKVLAITPCFDLL